MRIVAGDIGGTNARFALAEVADGRVLSLGEPVVLAAAGSRRAGQRLAGIRRRRLASRFPAMPPSAWPGR